MKSVIPIVLLFLSVILVSAEVSPTPTPLISANLETALSDTVNKSIVVAGDAKDFLLAQLPDVVKQLLLWKLCQNVVTMLILGIASFIGIKYLLKWAKSIYSGDMDIIAWIPFGLVSLANLGAAILAVICLTQALQIWIAPKVYLIEYASSVLKH